MSRNYGNVGRRSGNTAWQWIIIGGILGFGCSVVLVLGALAFGILNLDGQAVASAETQTPFIITATAAPVTPTVTEELTIPTQQELVIEAPTATPTIDPTRLTPEPTVSPTNPPPVIGFGETPTTSGDGQSLSTDGGSTTTDQRFEVVAGQASSLVSIQGGTFEMGTNLAEVQSAVQECIQGYGGEPGACDVGMAEDSYPPHQVTISPFLIEETEVSYAQFLAFLNAMGPGSHTSGCFGFPCAQTTNNSETSNIAADPANYTVNIAITNYPVAGVTWYGAQAYCQAIGRRLPTEAEWERAARGPSNTIFPWGNNWIGANAATRRNAEGLRSEPQPVDSFPAGAVIWGDGSLLNMAGNVAEWVSDWYSTTYYGSAVALGPDPQGPPTGSTKVNRGGSWDTMPFFARAVHRRDQTPALPTADIGFRCADDNTTGAADGPIGSSPLPDATIDPATLGISESESGSDEETTANSQPTLPPAPTTQPTVTPFATPGTVSTLVP